MKNMGHLTKLETTPKFHLYNSSLCSIAKKGIYPPVFPPVPLPNNLLLRSSWGRVLKAFSKSRINVSTCPPLFKIFTQSFITVVNWVSQLCLFLNACCLSDKSWYSSKWAMIFEHTICSSNLHGTHVEDTGR